MMITSDHGEDVILMAGRRYWTRELLIERLIEKSELIDEVPKVSDMRKADERFASYLTYIREFGSWEEALVAAGFEEGYGRRGRRSKMLPRLRA